MIELQALAPKASCTALDGRAGIGLRIGSIPQPQREGPARVNPGFRIVRSYSAQANDHRGMPVPGATMVAINRINQATNRSPLNP